MDYFIKSQQGNKIYVHSNVYPKIKRAVYYDILYPDEVNELIFETGPDAVLTDLHKGDWIIGNTSFKVKENKPDIFIDQCCKNIGFDDIRIKEQILDIFRKEYDLIEYIPLLYSYIEKLLHGVEILKKQKIRRNLIFLSYYLVQGYNAEQDIYSSYEDISFSSQDILNNIFSIKIKGDFSGFVLLYFFDMKTKEWQLVSKKYTVESFSEYFNKTPGVYKIIFCTENDKYIKQYYFIRYKDIDLQNVFQDLLEDSNKKELKIQDYIKEYLGDSELTTEEKEEFIYQTLYSPANLFLPEPKISITTSQDFHIVHPYNWIYQLEEPIYLHAVTKDILNNKLSFGYKKLVKTENDIIFGGENNFLFEPYYFYYATKDNIPLSHLITANRKNNENENSIIDKVHIFEIKSLVDRIIYKIKMDLSEAITREVVLSLDYASHNLDQTELYNLHYEAFNNYIANLEAIDKFKVFRSLIDDKAFHEKVDEKRLKEIIIRPYWSIVNFPILKDEQYIIERIGFKHGQNVEYTIIKSDLQTATDVCYKHSDKTKYDYCCISAFSLKTKKRFGYIVFNNLEDRLTYNCSYFRTAVNLD